MIERISGNEKLALYGLHRFPSYNDRKLSEELGLKMSTVTAIRNRLKREGYFKTVRMPYLEKLGGELLGVGYTRLNVLKGREEMIKILREVMAQIEDVFFAITDQFQMVTFSFYRNYTDAWLDSEKSHQLLAERGALSPRYSRRSVALFPINQTKFIRFFEFSKYLRGLHGLDYPEPEPQLTLKPEKVTPRVMTRIEKKVYHGLVKYPDLVDNAVARKIGVTRQSVTKIRKRFESERLIATIRVPNFQRLGAEILGFTYFETTPSSTFAARKKAVEQVVKQIPAFLHISGNRDGFMMALIKDFKTLQKESFDISKLYMEKGYFKEEPQVVMMSVDDLVVVKDFVFGPLVKKVLGMEDDGGK